MARRATNTGAIKHDELAQRRILAIINWLATKIPMTLAKRLVAMLLFALGVSVEQTMALTKLSERTVYDVRRKVQQHEPETLGEMMHIQVAGGRQPKLKDVENKIVEEVNANNYVSYRQVADMVKDKFGIEVSKWTIKRLLKKKGLKD